jgi:hypothetical protein
MFCRLTLSWPSIFPHRIRAHLVSADERFEVDGANAARDFLRSHGAGRH